MQNYLHVMEKKKTQLASKDGTRNSTEAKANIYKYLKNRILGSSQKTLLNKTYCKTPKNTHKMIQ